MAYALTLGAFSFIIAVIWGRPLINQLRRWRIGKQIRVGLPEGHQEKAGTPTMGGILFVVPVLLITGVLNLSNLLGWNVIGQSTLILFFCLGSHFVLGIVDDWQGVRGLHAKGEGMSPRMKSAFQVLFATIVALILYYGPPHWDYVGVPRFPDFFRIGPLIIPVTIFLIVAMSNAVNFADGLDGMCASLAMVAYACYGVIAFLQDQIYVTAFCFTVVGALLAFLWYNAYPAQLFMGDAGSLPLGATLGLVAVMTGQWLLLPIVGLVFVAIAGSVTLQVLWFKWTRRRYGEGRRLFRIAPLHHHFEVIGWSPMQIKERFWIVSVLSGMLGVALALW